HRGLLRGRRRRLPSRDRRARGGRLPLRSDRRSALLLFHRRENAQRDRRRRRAARRPARAVRAADQRLYRRRTPADCDRRSCLPRERSFHVAGVRRLRAHRRDRPRRPQRRSFPARIRRRTLRRFSAAEVHPARQARRLGPRHDQARTLGRERRSLPACRGSNEIRPARGSCAQSAVRVCQHARRKRHHPARSVGEAAARRRDGPPHLGGVIEFAAFVVLGAICGFVGGLFGVGGAVVAIPVLGIAFGRTEQVAQGTAFVMVVPTLIVGLVRYFHVGKLDTRMALTMAAGSLPTTLAGALLATSVSNKHLRIAYSCFLLLMMLEYARRSL